MAAARQNPRKGRYMVKRAAGPYTATGCSMLACLWLCNLRRDSASQITPGDLELSAYIKRLPFTQRNRTGPFVIRPAGADSAALERFGARRKQQVGAPRAGDRWRAFLGAAKGIRRISEAATALLGHAGPCHQYIAARKARGGAGGKQMPGRRGGS
jgi:hypothetical protein